MLEFPSGRGSGEIRYMGEYVGNVLENAGDIRRVMNKNCIATTVRFMISVLKMIYH